jgi:hypothetical protein
MKGVGADSKVVVTTRPPEEIYTLLGEMDSLVGIEKVKVFIRTLWRKSIIDAEKS